MGSLSLLELLSLHQQCWPAQQPYFLLPCGGQQLQPAVLAARFKRVQVYGTPFHMALRCWGSQIWPPVSCALASQRQQPRTPAQTAWSCRDQGKSCAMCLAACTVWGCSLHCMGSLTCLLWCESGSRIARCMGTWPRLQQNTPSDLDVIELVLLYFPHDQLPS